MDPNISGSKPGSALSPNRSWENSQGLPDTRFQDSHFLTHQVTCQKIMWFRDTFKTNGDFLSWSHCSYGVDSRWFVILKIAKKLLLFDFSTNETQKTTGWLHCLVHFRPLCLQSQSTDPLLKSITKYSNVEMWWVPLEISTCSSHWSSYHHYFSALLWRSLNWLHN